MQQRPPHIQQIQVPSPYQRQQRKHKLRSTVTGCCLGVFTVFVLGVFFCIGTLMIYTIVPPDPTNVLILGSDARPSEADADIARTDSIMVLGVNPPKREVSLFSVPRDVFIQSPNMGWLRANTVIRNAELNDIRGIDEMQASMENTFDMPIDHYARVDFQAFIDLVDALGGITIDVPKRIVDNTYPTADYGTMRIEFEAGEQTMDGERALIYARTRHADDDYERAARQQQVIQAIMSKLANPLNFYRYPGVAMALFNNFETDMSPPQMLALAPGILLNGYSPSQVEQFVVTRDYIYRGSAGEAYPSTELIEPWVEEHMR